MNFKWRDEWDDVRIRGCVSRNVPTGTGCWTLICIQFLFFLFYHFFFVPFLKRYFFHIVVNDYINMLADCNILYIFHTPVNKYSIYNELFLWYSKHICAFSIIWYLKVEIKISVCLLIFAHFDIYENVQCSRDRRINNQLLLRIKEKGWECINYVDVFSGQRISIINWWIQISRIHWTFLYWSCLPLAIRLYANRLYPIL